MTRSASDAFKGLGHLDKMLSEGPDGFRILRNRNRCDLVAHCSGLVADALHEVERVCGLRVAVGLGGIVVVLGKAEIGCNLSDGALQKGFLLGEVLLLRGAEGLLNIADDVFLLRPGFCCGCHFRYAPESDRERVWVKRLEEFVCSVQVRGDALGIRR